MNPSDSGKTTLEHGFDVLRLMITQGKSLGVSQVAAELGIAKSSAHRILRILGMLGFVHQNAESHMYGLSPEIFSFIHVLATQYGQNDRLAPIVRETAARLRCGASLSMLGGTNTYIVFAAGDEGDTASIGASGPAFATSAGKLLVSQKAESEWPRYAPHPGMTRRTQKTNLDPQKFFEELRHIRTKKIAWNLRETTFRIASVAAPVREPLVKEPRIAVALMVQYNELPSFDRSKLEDEVKALAARLSLALGVSKSVLKDDT